MESGPPGWRSRQVSAILTRIGTGKLGRLGLEQPVRYERERPGELVHIDAKKLGRIQGGAGWRVCGGPQHYSRTFTVAAGNVRNTVGWSSSTSGRRLQRLAYDEVLSDEKAVTAIGFLRRAVAFVSRYGIQVERPLTYAGSCYRSAIHALACRSVGIKHLRTRPYRPQTNGKQNASSAPGSTAGPMVPSPAQATNAPQHLTAGSITTTINSTLSPRPSILRHQNQPAQALQLDLSEQCT